jgi:hypothetical protein
MTGAAIAIDGVSADDTILSVKQRLFAVNRKLPVHRQRLMYRPGPRGMDPLADHDTLGGAGVAQDGSAELDVLLTPLTDVEIAARGPEVSFVVVTVPVDNIIPIYRFQFSSGAMVSFCREPGNTPVFIFIFFHPAKRDSLSRAFISCANEQLIEAAKDGRSDDILELLGQGVNVHFKDMVRHKQRASYRAVRAVQLLLVSRIQAITCFYVCEVMRTVRCCMSPFAFRVHRRR